MMTPPHQERAARSHSRFAFQAATALLGALGALGPLGVTGCAKDVILPVDSVCGDLKKDPNEECDLESEGCSECKVVKGWTCQDETCTPTCGDSIVAGDEECDPPDSVTCDSSCHAGSKAEACDMTGYWVARQTDFSIDTVLSQVQTSTNWYLYKLSQTGDAFQADQALNCGIHVTGSANADLTDPGVKGLIHLNPQDVDSPRGPRKGTFTGKADAKACEFSFDRNYMVRGGEARLLPADFASKPALSTLPPLPSEDDPEHPTGTGLDGALDVDEDGHPGVAFRISGNASGVRNVVQRDWNEYFTATDVTIPANAIEFVAQVHFDNQENVLFVSRCPLLGCGILLAGSHPATNLQDRVTFLYLGKELTDAGVARVIGSPLKADVDADVTTCANARLALPHDPSKK